jgi:hypothetical protein
MTTPRTNHAQMLRIVRAIEESRIRDTASERTQSVSAGT